MLYKGEKSVLNNRSWLKEPLTVVVVVVVFFYYFTFQSPVLVFTSKEWLPDFTSF